MGKNEHKSFGFSTDDMLTYLEEFDYLQKKYLIKDNELLLKLETFEKNQQSGQLQKLSPAYIGQTMNRVYGFAYKDRMQGAKIFSYVFSKVINEFLNIKGLELLFNEHYYDFEWDMHLEFDTEKSTYNYYRDHMEHQVRNMYMMLKLLDDYGFINEFKRLLSDKSNNKISEYISTRLNQFVDAQCFFDGRSNLLYECACKYFDIVFEQYLESSFVKKPDVLNNPNKFVVSVLEFLEFNSINFPKKYFYENFLNFITENMDEYECFSFDSDKIIIVLKCWIKQLDKDVLTRLYFNEYTLSYIIRSASIISALFHDVSYPLCFFMNMQKRIGQYLPSMNAFIHNTEADIDRVVSLLQPSLLLILVSEKEIRSKLAKNQKKYDHGVFSAIALLLSFYESGRIHQLPIDKQIAIELAAVAIYNHNFSYYINDSSAKEYYRPIFSQNPISFLLKICDDMQEWDRRYFELSKEDENIFCPECGSPIIKYKKYVDDELKEYLICRCCEDKEKNYYKSTFFLKRSMYTVTTCNSIQVIPVKKNLVFRLNYDLVNLLHMIQIGCTYAAYRSKELNKLKILMLNQRYSNNTLNNMYLDYIMSANPLFLKSQILAEYIVCDILKDYKIDNTFSLKQKCDLIINNFIESFGQNLFISIDEFLNTFDETNSDYLDFLNNLVDCFKTNVFDVTISSDNIFMLMIYDAYVDKGIEIIRNQILHYINKRVEEDFDEKRKNILKRFIVNKLDGFNSRFKALLDDAVLNSKAAKINYFKQLVTTVDLSQYGDFSNDILFDKLLFYFKLASYIVCSFLPGYKIPSYEGFKEKLLSSSNYVYQSAQVHFVEVIDILLNDVYSIIKNQTNVYAGDLIDVTNYTKQFKADKKVYQMIEQYINPVNWYDSNSKSYYDFSKDNLDFHSDLLLFDILGEKLRTTTGSDFKWIF